MPETQPHSPELLQAQVALYATDQIEREHPGRERLLLERLGEIGISTEAPELITYPSPRDKKEFVDGQITVVEPAGTPLPLFEKKGYVDSLKNSARREQSRNLADMARNYSAVAPIIERLDIPFNDYQKAAEHPNLLGRGSRKAVFGFKAEIDGVEKDLVAMVDHGKDSGFSRQIILERAANLALVKGVPGFEQGVAWSNDPPVMVAERAKGKHLGELSPEERAAIPTTQWETLTSNVEAVADKGISLDPMPENLFYDPEAGFTVIDFRISKPGQEAEAHQRNMDYIHTLQFGENQAA